MGIRFERAEDEGVQISQTLTTQFSGSDVTANASAQGWKGKGQKEALTGSVELIATRV